MLQFKVPLTKNNFLLYAAKEFHNPRCLGVSEFNSDLKRFMYIKKLLKRKEMDYRLLLNHLVILRNIFPAKALNRMVYFYMDVEYYAIIAGFLEFLDIRVDNIPELMGMDLDSDQLTLSKLKEL